MLVHQIWWQGENQIPAKYQEYQRTTDKVHPVKRKIWDEVLINELIQMNYLADWEWFRSLPLMIQKIDVAKYFILHNQGGVYLDMDMEVVKDLTPLYGDQIVVGEIPLCTSDKWFFNVIGLKRAMINNGVIFSPPRNEFWMNFIQHLKRTIHPPGFWGDCFQSVYVMTSAGPFAFTNFIASHPEGIKILPQHVLENNVYSSQGMYIIHHHGMGWVHPITKLLYWVWYHFNWILGLLIVYWLWQWLFKK